VLANNHHLLNCSDSQSAISPSPACGKQLWTSHRVKLLTRSSKYSPSAPVIYTNLFTLNDLPFLLFCISYCQLKYLLIVIDIPQFSETIGSLLQD